MNRDENFDNQNIFWKNTLIVNRKCLCKPAGLKSFTKSWLTAKFARQKQYYKVDSKHREFR